MPQAASTTAPARQTILHGFAALTQTCQRMTCSGPIVHYTFRLLESSPPNEPLMADQIVITEKDQPGERYPRRRWFSLR